MYRLEKTFYKPNGAARPILDTSPWTTYYVALPVWLYSTAEVITAIPDNAQMIKLDLMFGFYHITI
jgi:hypothetical protein